MSKVNSTFRPLHYPSFFPTLGETTVATFTFNLYLINYKGPARQKHTELLPINKLIFNFYRLKKSNENLANNLLDGRKCRTV